mmetsp:Transcript_25776/g.40353  ORF Transcript_25776/g.40353 Transcript_25776/m.40353 type:complete len:265 (+) Transcript_25776:189-983(+)
MHKMKEEEELSCPKAISYSKWLSDDVLRAIQERAVNKIVLAIHEKPVLGEVACGPLIESYSFVFHYNEEGDYIMKLQRETNKTGELFKIETSRDEVRIKMESLLRGFLTMITSLEELPEDYLVAVRMVFKNDTETEQFKTAHFHETDDFRITESDSEDEDLEFNAKIGTLCTHHHALGMRMKARNRKDDVMMTPTPNRMALDEKPTKRRRTPKSVPDSVQCSQEFSHGNATNLKASVASFPVRPDEQLVTNKALKSADGRRQPR